MSLKTKITSLVSLLTGKMNLLKGWIDGKADDASVLHTTGDEQKDGDLRVNGSISVGDRFRFSSKTSIDFANGTLVKTNIPEASNTMFDFHVIGNPYNGVNKSINTVITGYNYIPGNDIIELKGISDTVYPSPIKIFCYQGYLCFWLPKPGDYTTFRFWLGTSNGLPWPEITEVLNLAMPTSGVSRENDVALETRATREWVGTGFATAAQGALADTSLQNPGGTISDANAPLSDGIYAVVGHTINFPFDSGILIVKNDSARRCDLAFGWKTIGGQYRHKTATRRWTAGVVQPWEVSWTDLDFSQAEINDWRTALQPGTAISNIANLQTELDAKGVQLTADQPNAKILLKDANGNTLTSLDVGFLNNEGTTIVFNATTQEIELKDDEGNLLSSFPASALVANMPDNLHFNATTPHVLELRDVSNNVLSSVSIAIANISGLAAALAGKEPAFTKNTAFNKDFGNVAGTVLEGNSWGNFISYVDQVAKKTIRVDGSASVTLAAGDDVVIMTDSTAAIGTITIPAASAYGGKEYWLVQHWNYALLSQNYIASDGSTTNVVAEALHLKSDGIKWYQTNNRGTPNYVKISGPATVLVGTITKYTGTSGGTLTLPDPAAFLGKTLKIIAESPAKLSATYIDTDGSQADYTGDPLPAGAVIELASSGENWEKTN